MESNHRLIGIKRHEFSRLVGHPAARYHPCELQGIPVRDPFCHTRGPSPEGFPRVGCFSVRPQSLLSSNLPRIHPVFRPAVAHQAEPCPRGQFFLLFRAAAVFAGGHGVVDLDEVVSGVVALVTLVGVDRHLESLCWYRLEETVGFEPTGPAKSRQFSRLQC